jgi:hypothetical protein
MMVVGVIQFLQGLVAVIDGRTFFVNTPNYLLSLNATTWGWVHLVFGAVVVVAGFFVLTGNILARSVGIALAATQALVNFAWLPYYPIWGVIVIAFDVLVIWSLSTLRLSSSDPSKAAGLRSI